MFNGLDPKKMQAMMRQIGISQENIDATKVTIETPEGKIIIENPQVAKVKMQGQVSFQISGDVLEESKEEESEESKLEEDLKTIMEQTGVDKGIAAIELEKNNGDIAETIIALSNKKK
jgi:nascent polypeptide-associated complex subunit alpha